MAGASTTPAGGEVSFSNDNQGFQDLELRKMELITVDVDESDPIRPEDIKVECAETIGPVSIDLDMTNSAYLQGSHVLKNIIDSEESPDVILALSDGKLGAHRMVLSACSPFLKFLLLEQDQNLRRTATLILPDINKEIMKILLNMAYTGRMVYSKDNELEVLEAMDLLKFAEYATLNLSVQEVEGLQELSEEKIDLEPEFMPSQCQHPNDELGKTKPGINEYIIGDNRQLGCAICKRFFRHIGQLLNHIEEKHKEAWLRMKASDQELQALTFCNVCGKQQKSIQVTNKCLAKHDMVRCYICLDAVKKIDCMEHYKSLHTEGSNEETQKRFTKCRWCSRSISYDGQGGPLLRHCIWMHFRESHVKKVRSSAPQLKRSNDTKDPDSKAKHDDVQIRELRVVLNRISDDILGKCVKQKSKQRQEAESQKLQSEPGASSGCIPASGVSGGSNTNLSGMNESTNANIEHTISLENHCMDNISVFEEMSTNSLQTKLELQSIEVEPMEIDADIDEGGFLKDQGENEVEAECTKIVNLSDDEATWTTEDESEPELPKSSKSPTPVSISKEIEAHSHFDKHAPVNTNQNELNLIPYKNSENKALQVAEERHLISTSIRTRSKLKEILQTRTRGNTEEDTPSEDHRHRLRLPEDEDVDVTTKGSLQIGS